LKIEVPGIDEKTLMSALGANAVTVHWRPQVGEEDKERNFRRGYPVPHGEDLLVLQGV